MAEKNGNVLLSLIGSSPRYDLPQYYACMKPIPADPIVLLLMPGHGTLLLSLLVVIAALQNAISNRYKRAVHNSHPEHTAKSKSKTANHETRNPSQSSTRLLLGYSFGLLLSRPSWE
jgi:hypothetical protein